MVTDPDDCVARGHSSQRHADFLVPAPLGTLRGRAHPKSLCWNCSAWGGVCGSGDSPRNPGSRSCLERSSHGTAWRVAPRPPRGQELGVSTAGAPVKTENPLPRDGFPGELCGVRAVHAPLFMRRGGGAEELWDENLRKAGDTLE